MLRILLLLLLLLLPHQVATPWSQPQAHCSTMQLLAVSAFPLRQLPIHSFLTSAPPNLRRRQQLTASLPMGTFPQKGMCLPMGTSAYSNKRRVASEFSAAAAPPCCVLRRRRGGSVQRALTLQLPCAASSLPFASSSRWSCVQSQAIRHQHSHSNSHHISCFDCLRWSSGVRLEVPKLTNAVT